VPAERICKEQKLTPYSGVLMRRIIQSVAVAFILLSPVFASDAPAKLDLNDVTWLWPVPASPEELRQIIAVTDLAGEDGAPVWSDEQFQDVLTTSDSEAAKVDDNRIRLSATARQKDKWRIVAFRVDPTAPGGHEIIRKNFGERPQIRLVLQPVEVKNDSIQVEDVTVHLVYDFMIPGEQGPVADRERFKAIIRGLDDLKKLVEDAGIQTSGVPLGVHPGLKAKAPGLNDAVREFLSQHLRSDKLNAMALMGLDGPEPWIFVAMSRSGSSEGRFRPVAQLPAQMLSFRPGKRGVFPEPKVNNLNSVASKFPMPSDKKDRQGVSAAVLFNESEFDPDARAVVSEAEDGSPVSHDEIKNGDIPDIIADPIRSHFFNTDCLSCHTETRRRIRLKLEPGKFAFIQDGSVPPISEEVLPKHDWNVRNLGWFPPSRFIGGGPTVPTVTQRTANETAEVVQFIERQYRHDPAPGPETPEGDVSGEDQDPQEPDVTFLDQGWTDEERHDFYFVGQGSQLLPYSWFLSLEHAETEELLRSNANMRALGFIPQPPGVRNPDGLPIGFAKDSSRVEVELKAGLLGVSFNEDHYPLTEDWLGFTCAACHTAELVARGKTIRIEGGGAMADMEGFLAELARAMRATIDDDTKFERFQVRIKKHAGGDIDTTGLRDDLAAYTPVIERLVSRNKADTPYGLGRLDAFGAILNQVCEASLAIPENHRKSNAPVSYPFLWDTPQLDWVQWNSSVDVPISRNVGEVLGVFAHAKLTGAPEIGQFGSSAKVDNLHRLEDQITQLRAPKWPEDVLGEIDMEKAEAGKELFASNCASCHNMRDENGNFEMTEANKFGRSFIKTTSVPFTEIGTDPQMARNFVTRTAMPGDLKDVLAPVLATEKTKQGLKNLSATIVALGEEEPDFENEVPAAMVLAAAVRGVIERDLSSRLQNLTAEERREIQLELRGHREGGSPPNAGGGYKARPLNGVWATAPFGHAGSVPNLYQWLLPENERVKSFSVGTGEFDPVHVGIPTDVSRGGFEFKVENDEGDSIPGNSNKGHSGPGHTNFTDEERWQLIEYLKTLE
jgi:hypothetical protein